MLFQKNIMKMASGHLYRVRGTFPSTPVEFHRFTPSDGKQTGRCGRSEPRLSVLCPRSDPSPLTTSSLFTDEHFHCIKSRSRLLVKSSAALSGSTALYCHPKLPTGTLSIYIERETIRCGSYSDSEKVKVSQALRAAVAIKSFCRNQVVSYWDEEPISFFPCQQQRHIHCPASTKQKQ